MGSDLGVLTHDSHIFDEKCKDLLALAIDYVQMGPKPRNITTWPHDSETHVRGKLILRLGTEAAEPHAERVHRAIGEPRPRKYAQEIGVSALLHERLQVTHPVGWRRFLPPALDWPVFAYRRSRSAHGTAGVAGLLGVPLRLLSRGQSRIDVENFAAWWRL
jgi:hypothetical protein